MLSKNISQPLVFKKLLFLAFSMSTVDKIKEIEAEVIDQIR